MIRYTFRSVDKQRWRQLDAVQLYSFLALALRHGWRPSPSRLRDNLLYLDGEIDQIESYDMAAALERGLKREMAQLSPDAITAIFETIAVLRHGAVRLWQQHTITA